MNKQNKLVIEEGRRACRDGFGLGDSPYGDRTDSNALWERGWRSAYREKNGAPCSIPFEFDRRDIIHVPLGPRKFQIMIKRGLLKDG